MIAEPAQAHQIDTGRVAVVARQLTDPDDHIALLDLVTRRDQELGDLGAVFRVIADRAREQHDRPTVGANAPVVHHADGKLVVREGDPRVARVGRRHNRQW